MSDSYPGDPEVDYSAAVAGGPDASDTATQVVAAEVATTDGSSPPPLKPGWQTTEFWTTHIFSLLSLATALGWIGPNFSKDHEPVVNAVALLASVLAPAVYAHSRGVVKRAHQQAVAQVISSATAPPAV